MSPSAKDISELDMLEAFEAKRLPMDVTFAQFPEKVVYAKMDKLDRRGYLECGINIRWGWLTPEGEARLKELRATLNSAALPDAPMRSNSGE